MLITLGMDSAFGGMEGLYTAIVDEYPICRKYTITTRVLISAIPLITSLPTVTYAGIYWVQWLDTFAISPSLLVIVVAEVFTVSWLYGVDKMCDNIKEMNGTAPFINWRISWKYICPLALTTIVVFDVIYFEGISYGSYAFPKWSMNLGYLLNILVLLPIPLLVIKAFVQKKQTQKQRATATAAAADAEDDCTTGVA